MLLMSSSKFAYIVLLYFRRYHEVITYYEKALALSTRSLSTYAGLAYTYHLQDNLTAAIIYYHKEDFFSMVSNLKRRPNIKAFYYLLTHSKCPVILSIYQALWLKPDDQFCTEMLTLALVDECRHGVEPKSDSHQNDVFIY
ncbi:hypothetical protein RHSIM_Rhsim12G0175500 [Rhododendron simsii]|uniref:Uncharacterized protein n=1 Tax=Rhododendron simsii TaxID=118357 RepID=A0A834L8C1_RHOSS|nr:hypothetical protein RHSIM_Rhsim12G0175500 [Rhododendron simsii]